MSFLAACFVPTLQQTIYRTGVYRKALCQFFYANAFVVCFQNQFSSFIVQHSSHLLCSVIPLFAQKLKYCAVLLKIAINRKKGCCTRENSSCSSPFYVFPKLIAAIASEHRLAYQAPAVLRYVRSCRLPDLAVHLRRKHWQTWL